MTDNKSLSAELRRWRHKVRGTEYDEIGTAELQASTGDVEEGALLTVYRGDDGKLWARRAREFGDGRFERVAAPVSSPGNAGLREAIALIAEPEAWRARERHRERVKHWEGHAHLAGAADLAEAFRVDANAVIKPSLAKADAILSLLSIDRSEAVEECARVAETQTERTNRDCETEEGQIYGAGYENACADAAAAIRKLSPAGEKGK